MKTTVENLKQSFYNGAIFLLSLTKNTFNRDILVLVLVSIMIGSLLAVSISTGANSYFSKTLTNLVGDYGEYDVLIQVREEMKDDAAKQIIHIIGDAFPGAKFKEGPTLTGKTNLFVALPDQYKTRKVYEDLGKTFGSIPGGAGVGVLTEPRLTIRGVPEGAKSMLMERIVTMDGVRFTFHDGASVGVVLNSVEKSAALNEQIKNILGQYRVIEVSFPVGSEPSNPIRLGENIAGAIRTQMHLPYAENVSVDGKNDDMTYMVSTMMELKRFLTAYASQVALTPMAGVKLMPGDKIVFQGSEPNSPATGSAPAKGNTLVEVKVVKEGGSAEGQIVQGDAADVKNLVGYRLDKDVIGPQAVTAAVRNPRQELSGALTETTRVVSKVPGFSQDTQNLSTIALNALDNYSSSLSAVEKTLTNLQAAGGTIQSATSGLANLDTAALQGQLDSSSKALGGLSTTLQVVKLVNPEVGTTIDALAGTQRNLNSMKDGLAALDHVAADARRAKGTIDSIVTSGQSSLTALRAFDTQGARTNLQNVNSRLTELQTLNVPLITGQLTYLAAAVPNLKDEDISHSLALLDKFIAGQVIPGERIQILTTNNVSLEALTPIIQAQVGHSNISLYSTSLGMIEPNTRAEVMQLLAQVRAVLAAMTAIVMTILFLVLDHTAIMTAIRRKRLVGKVKVSGWRGFLLRIKITFTAPERRYGMAVGAVILTVVFILSGAGLPMLPWIGVPFLGALLGLIVAGYTDKISPISVEEVTAGEALGLSFDEVMREIVVPSGRPGLMQKLNQRKVKFK